MSRLSLEHATTAFEVINHAITEYSKTICFEILLHCVCNEHISDNWSYKTITNTPVLVNTAHMQWLGYTLASPMAYIPRVPKQNGPSTHLDIVLGFLQYWSLEVTSGACPSFKNCATDS